MVIRKHQRLERSDLGSEERKMLKGKTFGNMREDEKCNKNPINFLN